MRHTSLTRRSIKRKYRIDSRVTRGNDGPLVRCPFAGFVFLGADGFFLVLHFLAFEMPPFAVRSVRRVGDIIGHQRFVILTREKFHCANPKEKSDRESLAQLVIYVNLRVHFLREKSFCAATEFIWILFLRAGQEWVRYSGFPRISRRFPPAIASAPHGKRGLFLPSYSPLP